MTLVHVDRHDRRAGAIVKILESAGKSRLMP